MSRNSDVTWKLVYVLVWVSVYLCCKAGDILLTDPSVVELTVGVMCSCLTSFPGFFRYHLPLLRSIMSFVNSSFRKLSSVKLQSSPSIPDNTEKLATRDMKITLGSRVNGRGHFMGSATATWAEHGSRPLSEPFIDGQAFADERHSTRRDDYEIMSIRQHPAWPRPPMDQKAGETTLWDPRPRDAELGLATQSDHHRKTSERDGILRSLAKGKKKSRKLRPDRRGYWDVVSVFRTGGVVSTTQSNVCSHNERDLPRCGEPMSSSMA